MRKTILLTALILLSTPALAETNIVPEEFEADMKAGGSYSETIAVFHEGNQTELDIWTTTTVNGEEFEGEEVQISHPNTVDVRDGDDVFTLTIETDHRLGEANISVLVNVGDKEEMEGEKPPEEDDGENGEQGGGEGDLPEDDEEQDKDENGSENDTDNGDEETDTQPIPDDPEQEKPQKIEPVKENLDFIPKIGTDTAILVNSVLMIITGILLVIFG